MKTPNKFKPLDTADSMAAAASALDVPLEMVKAAKRAGCSAFRGSRVHLRSLADAIAAVQRPSVSEVLTTIVELVANVLSDKTIRRADAVNLSVAVHNGFGAALLVLEPARVDQFLRESAALFSTKFSPRVRQGRTNKIRSRKTEQ